MWLYTPGKPAGLADGTAAAPLLERRAGRSAPPVAWRHRLPVRNTHRAALAVALAGCGGEDPTAQKPKPPVQLRVSTPSDTALVLGSTVQVSGNVSPSTAQVQVQGRRAQVSGGRFTLEVPLEPGAERDRRRRDRAQPLGGADRLPRHARAAGGRPGPRRRRRRRRRARGSRAAASRLERKRGGGFLDSLVPKGLAVCEQAPAAGNQVRRGSDRARRRRPRLLSSARRRDGDQRDPRLRRGRGRRRGRSGPRSRRGPCGRRGSRRSRGRPGRRSPRGSRARSRACPGRGTGARTRSTTRARPRATPVGSTRCTPGVSGAAAPRRPRPRRPSRSPGDVADVALGQRPGRAARAGPVAERRARAPSPPRRPRRARRRGRPRGGGPGAASGASPAAADQRHCP